MEDDYHSHGHGAAARMAQANRPHRRAPPQLQSPKDDAAYTSYTELHQAGVALDLTPDENVHSNLTIHRASSTPQHMIVHPFPGERVPSQPPPIFLVRQENATQAYVLHNPYQNNNRPPDKIVGRNRHAEWGGVWFGTIYPAIPGRPHEFQAPDPHNCRHVAIKRLSKQAVAEYLYGATSAESDDMMEEQQQQRQQPPPVGFENPFVEMARMQEMGDNIHVLRHEEFLHDDFYWYIVTPKGRCVHEMIPWLSTESFLEPQRCHAIVNKMLEILLYLLRHGIQHHDVSPDNFLFLNDDVHEDALVIFDLALSTRIPINPHSTTATTSSRALVAAHAPFGTFAYMDPMPYHRQPYDAVGMDLWAVAVIWYNLLTNQVLYRIPCPTDLSFRYCIMARGLSSIPHNEQALEVFNMRDNDGTFRPGALFSLEPQATAHLNICPDVMDVLENVLRVNPAERYTLAQVVQSAHVQNSMDY